MRKFRSKWLGLRGQQPMIIDDVIVNYVEDTMNDGGRLEELSDQLARMKTAMGKVASILSDGQQVQLAGILGYEEVT